MIASNNFINKGGGNMHIMININYKFAVYVFVIYSISMIL